MPTITILHRDLEKLAGIKLPLEELNSRLELVKGELKGSNPESGELRVELNDTNRPDLWCAEGIARQLRYKLSPQKPAYDLFSKAPAAQDRIQADPSVRDIRPVIGGFVVKDLEVTEPLLLQLIQTQEKLCENYGQKRRSIAIGVYPLKDIVFPLSYRAVRPEELKFTPLGGEREMTLAEILKEHPKGKEYAHLLEGFERYPVIRDSRGGVLSFPPIINSRHLGEVAVGDSALFVEATGLAFEQVALALNILAYNLCDRGASILPVKAVYEFETEWPKVVTVPVRLENKVTVPFSDFERLTGEKLDAKEIAETLRAYGCAVKADGKRLAVSTEACRLDYLHPVDAVEDYLICRGYSSFETEAPRCFTVGGAAPITALSDRVRRIIAGLGFEEIMSNVLMSRQELAELTPCAEKIVEIDNVMIETYGALRNSLIPGLLRLESASQKAAYPHRVFEVGEAVACSEAAVLGSDTRMMCALLLSHPTANFSELHACLENLMYYLGLEAALVPADHDLFIPGRSGRLTIDGKPCGTIGEVAPAVLHNWGVHMPCSVCEIDLGQVLETLSA